jgi:hypothetical protein
MIFIVDEADLALGNPSRKGNKTANLHFHDEVHVTAAEGIEAVRGLREYVYGSVSITATPAALFICNFKVHVPAPR